MDFVKVMLGSMGQIMVAVPGHVYVFRPTSDNPGKAVCKGFGGIDLNRAFLRFGLDSIDAVGRFVAEAHGLTARIEVVTSDVSDIYDPALSRGNYECHF